MEKSLKIALIPLILILAYLFFYNRGSTIEYSGSKINGVNFVGTRQPVSQSTVANLQLIKANWIALVPYAFSHPGKPEVIFNTDRQWWGERKDGILTLVDHANRSGLNIMFKPHVWISREGWPGDYRLESEQAWQTWQDQYLEYILFYARLADSLQIPLFCLGTEYRQAVKERPEFWILLITKVRKVYKGQLTYAANWDNYEQVGFWQALDFIGINAYFPLTDKQSPSIQELVADWEPVKQKIRLFSEKYQKPIVFTEYGYESRDFATAGHWLNQDKANVNLQLQADGLEALYQTFWPEKWFAGGFIWKWFPDHLETGGSQDARFTPQNKPAQKVIQRWYRKFP
ncbi:MAG: glycoside hydrolase family 113 [Candidatus Cyclobacteriaceae bacterium M3_2C_046]